MSKRSIRAAVPAQPLTLGMAQSTPPYEIITDTIEVHRHRVYISDDLDAPAEYIELIDLLRSAAAHDTFTIYLNTAGGQVDTGLQLINAIRDSAAEVTMVLDTRAYSMGAFMFLAGDIQVVPDHAQLMLHHYSGGLLGKGNEQLAEVKATSRNFEKLFRSICLPFLTPDEITHIMNGQDLWLDAEEIRRRLKRCAREAEQGLAAAAEKPKRRRRLAAPAVEEAQG